MNNTKMPLNEVALRILQAADELMAKNGVQNLSTHKIAKQAGVSVGTIYLYFKDKEELLNCLVTYLFEQFHGYLAQYYDEDLSLFEQYQSLWNGTRQFLQQNPNVILNLHQYESLPILSKLLAKEMTSPDLACNKFIQRGKNERILANLDQNLIFILGLRTAWEMMRLQVVLGKPYSQAELDDVMKRSWKAITN